MANIPEKSKEKGGQEVAAELAGRIDTLQATVDLLKRNLDFVEGTNKFILIIVGLAFVGLVISVIFANIQATIANTNSQNQFNNSVQQILNAIKK